MANTAVWYHTKLPQNLTDIILNDINNLKAEKFLVDSKVGTGLIDVNIRNSKHSLISKNYWIGGFLWYYIMLSNRENFLYDITEYQVDI